MDPKAAPVLDPKLKETYDRVMNTPVPPPPVSEPIPAPTPPTFTPPPPPQPQPAPQQPDPVTTIPIATKPASSAVIVGASAKPHAKGGRLFPILFAVGGILFLAVYTIFWLKFFNLSVPFLPF